ncbi:MAG TPA: electron transfer flavoprotein subunit alpha/FixB family protein [Candidatus Bathyarchaeia archaeon]|nr:electron transfer flavoprotein subunit alpha/FixB family protein [Candidatus Bathyarchaeia archaeon]
MNDIVICVFASGGFDKAAQGLTGAARRLADQAGTQVNAILFGAGAGELASEVAPFVDKVVVAEDPQLAEYVPETSLTAMAQLTGDARVVLLSNDTYSQEIAPRLAHRLRGSAVGDGIGVEVQDGVVRVTRQVYGGKAQAVIALKRSPAVVWLRSRSFDPAPARTAAGEIVQAKLENKPDTRTRIVERKQEDSGAARLEDARIIVAGGRGIGGSEPFSKELQPLADLLGAQMAATRAACDAGWVPATWQVGQTGKKVAPELYLAIAISGASQHLAGISEAKNIAAINTDAEAPIFKHCRFGVVADYRKLLPLVREKLGAVCT